MPALAKVSPETLKDILLADGWAVYQEDEYNWSLVKTGKDSIEIPKKGKLVSFAVMEHCSLEVAELPPGDYFSLLEKVKSTQA